MGESPPLQPRVTVVTNRLSIGGAERHLAQVLPDLKARGLDVELFVLERGGILEPMLAAGGVNIAGPPRRLGRGGHLLVAAWALYRHIRARRPDVMHFFLPESYLVGALVAIAAGHRVCVMSRRSLSHYQRNHRWLARLERRLHRRMTALLGNSQAVVDDLVNEVGDRRKIGLIHNGVSLSALTDALARAELRRRLDLPADAFVMVIVGNLVTYKGHSDLLDALAPIRSRLPQPWRLLIVGRDEGIGSQLEAQADRQNLSDVVWLGERNDVETIWPVADLGLLVSHQEGFSNALIEAMGQGVPVVATAVGGNLDAIEDRRSGRLVPVGNAAQLGEAILALAWDPVMRRALGDAGRERAISEFSREGCVARYERLYRGIGRSYGRPVQEIIEGTG